MTRIRLIEAAETLFVRKGFDDTSVDEISETAGYSRGAFYSNFEDKDQVFLAVMDRRRPSLSDPFDDMSRKLPTPVDRTAAIRDWYANQWRQKNFMALQIDFSRRAMKHCSIRKRLVEFRREELKTATDSLVRFFGAAGLVPPDQPEILALVLLAVARGLASLAIDSEPDRDLMYTKAAALVFDRMTAPRIPQLGEL